MSKSNKTYLTEEQLEDVGIWWCEGMVSSMVGFMSEETLNKLFYNNKSNKIDLDTLIEAVFEAGERSGRIGVGQTLKELFEWEND